MDKELIEIYEKNNIRLLERLTKLAGIVGFYKSLLQTAIEVVKGETLIGSDYLEARQSEINKRIDEIYK